MPWKFAYTTQQLAALEFTLSAERLSTYRLRANGNTATAVRLYEDNTALSECLYGVLQGFEVSLRNSMHSELRGATGHDDWYDHITLRVIEMDQIQKAKVSTSQRRKLITPGGVVAELTLGFWVALVTKNYLNQLWIPYLHRAFRGKSIGLGLAHKRLADIRSLRNQVAHHQCILQRNLEDDYIKILETLAWICPETAKWVRETTRFEQCFQDRLHRKIIVPNIL